MIIRTTYQFDIALDPADELAPAEFYSFLKVLAKETGRVEWECVGHRFEVTVQTVDSP